MKCRAATVVGGIGTTPLAMGDLQLPPKSNGSGSIADAGIGAMGEIPNDVWLDVEPGARLVAKDPVSTRESVFVGRARGRACVDYAEESWLLRGIFESVPGAGERPGGEEWVVTPHATIRYAAAGMRIVVSQTTTDVEVAKGTAFVWVAADSSARITGEGGAPVPVALDQGWTRLEGSLRAVIRPDKPATAEEAARAALDGCSLAARTAHELAERIAAPDAHLGDLAGKHVEARRVARANCRSAMLRIEALYPSPARDALLATATAADASWRALGGRQTDGPTPEIPPVP
jgi:hypothetical protein